MTNALLGQLSQMSERHSQKLLSHPDFSALWPELSATARAALSAASGLAYMNYGSVKSSSEYIADTTALTALSQDWSLLNSSE
eukprot:201642-Amphidinium_carterae.1